MPQHLHIDYETFSLADINEVGAYRYAFDPSTEILCAGMALGDEEPWAWYKCPECGGRGCHETGGLDGPLRFSVPCSCTLDDATFERYLVALENPEVLIYAFNAQFEIAISQALMWKTWGIKPPAIERWRCAQSIARRAALPAGLDKLGEVLGLTTQKDKRGKALIKRFCVMQKEDKGTKGSKKNPGRAPQPPRRIYPHDDPAAFAEFLSYCKTDVVVEREATKRLSYFDDELNNQNYTLHEKINSRGVTVNVQALQKAQKLIEEETEQVGKRFRELTGFEFTQNKVLLAWLHSQGCHLDNLQAETIDNFLDPLDDDTCGNCGGEGQIDSGGFTPWDAPIFLCCPKCEGTGKDKCVTALRMKQSVAYVSIKKVQTMLDCAGPMDNHIRGMLNHHGATTGRSTNSLVQFQNMKRPAGHMAAETYKGSGVTWSEVAYKAICEGISREDLELIFGPVLEVISSCIRHFVHDNL